MDVGGDHRTRVCSHAFDSDVDKAIGVGMEELASMSAPL